MRTNEIKNNFDELKKMGRKIKRRGLGYETKKYIYDFQRCETITSFGTSITSFGQVKVSNTSENLLTEIHQIIYSLYQAKEITEEVYNNIMNSIKI